MRPTLVVLAACALLHAAAAQQPEKAPPAKPQKGLLQQRKDRAAKPLSTSVHEAWLQEVLDLDVKGAMKSYDRIQKTAPRNQPMRWIAVTRLAELQRMGVKTSEPLPTPSGTAPPAVRDALKQLREPVPVDEVLAQPDVGAKVPELNPATRLAK